MGGEETYVTVKSSSPKIALITGMERGLKALRPMSAYERIWGSSRTILASIFALPCHRESELNVLNDEMAECA